MKALRHYFALRRLEADVRRRRADMVDYREHRDAQLSRARKEHIAELVQGVVR